MKIHKEARTLARQMFRASLVNGRIDRGIVIRLVDLLIKNKPRHYQAALQALADLVAVEEARHHAVIEGAVELPPATTAKIVANLQSRHGEDLTTEFRIDPTLLGGLRIRIGDHVWDSSLRSRLERLAEQF